jgi:hypothetical protein
VQPEARDDKTRTYGPMSWKRAEGSTRRRRTPGAITDVIVAGVGGGAPFKVCIDKNGCPVHWAAGQKASAARAKRLATGRGAKAEDRWQREEARRKAEAARDAAERARWKQALPAVLEAVAAKVRTEPATASSYLAQVVVDECAGDA